VEPGVVEPSLSVPGAAWAEEPSPPVSSVPTSQSLHTAQPSPTVRLQYSPGGTVQEPTWKCTYNSLEYVERAQLVGELVTEKQTAYGDSFGKAGAVLQQLYPDGIPLAAYDDALVVVRIVDKLFRIATDKAAMGESPWQDIMGYALLALVRDER
jgi:hypothetical protein